MQNNNKNMLCISFYNVIFNQVFFCSLSPHRRSEKEKFILFRSETKRSKVNENAASKANEQQQQFLCSAQNNAATFFYRVYKKLINKMLNFSTQLLQLLI